MRTLLYLLLALLCLGLLVKGGRMLWYAFFPQAEVVDEEGRPQVSWIDTRLGRALMALTALIFFLLLYLETTDEPDNPLDLKFVPARMENGVVVPGRVE